MIEYSAELHAVIQKIVSEPDAQKRSPLVRQAMDIIKSLSDPIDYSIPHGCPALD